MKQLFSLGSRLAAFLVLLLIGLGARAQAWQSALAINASVMATTADANGNVYVVGYFNGTANIGGFSLTSVGTRDVFIAKWSSSINSFVWVQQAGSINSMATVVAVNDNSLYIAGYTGNMATFGTATLANHGGFVAKLTDVGSSSSFNWVKGTGNATPNQLAVSGSNVYAAGSLNGTAILSNISLVSAGDEDGFVAKLTDAGSTASFIWAQRLGGDSTDYVTALAVQGPNVYIAGFFWEWLALVALS